MPAFPPGETATTVFDMMKKVFPKIESSPASRFPFRRGLLGLALLFALLLTVGCAQGAYPLDIFYEMHYQQSYKAHEPPRLSVPDTAVAWYPPPQSTAGVAHVGQNLFDVNCAMCHGVAGRGDGPVLQRMIDDYGYTPALPADLTDPVVVELGVDGIQNLVAGGLVVMPSFSKLLTEDEMRVASEYVVNCLQGADPSACP